MSATVILRKRLGIMLQPSDTHAIPAKRKQRKRSSSAKLRLAAQAFMLLSSYSQPTILLILDSLNEVFAHDLPHDDPRSTSCNPCLRACHCTYIRRGLWVASLARDDLSQLFLVPLVHRVGRLFVLLLTSIRVDIGFADFTLNLLVVREFTPVACRVCDRRQSDVRPSTGSKPGRPFLAKNLPFSHTPALKKTHMMVLGSTPNGTLGWTSTVLKSSASAFF